MKLPCSSQRGEVFFVSNIELGILGSTSSGSRVGVSGTSTAASSTSASTATSAAIGLEVEVVVFVSDAESHEFGAHGLGGGVSIVLSDLSINLLDLSLIGSSRGSSSDLLLFVGGEFDGSSLLGLEIFFVGEAFFLRFFLGLDGGLGLGLLDGLFAFNDGGGFSFNGLTFFALFVSPASFATSFFAVSASSTAGTINFIASFVLDISGDVALSGLSVSLSSGSTTVTSTSGSLVTASTAGTFDGGVLALSGDVTFLSTFVASDGSTLAFGLGSSFSLLTSGAFVSASTTASGATTSSTSASAFAFLTGGKGLLDRLKTTFVHGTSGLLDLDLFGCGGLLGGDDSLVGLGGLDLLIVVDGHIGELVLHDL